jgi:outer membrane immunogenic protein
MRKYIIAAALAGTVAAPAFAQAVGGTPFTGPRIEGIVGYDSADPLGPRENGVVYGAALGFDVQAGAAVVGISTELTDSTTSGCATAIGTTTNFCSDIGRDLSVTGRVGGLVTPNTLIYATGGYTNLRVATDQTTGGATALSTRENLDGYRIGAGAEIAVGPNSFVKTEYRYSDYRGGLDRHQVVAGFGFRF